MAVLACALAGCWEEVHYTPPATGTGPAAASPTMNEASIANDDAAGDFGDDLAESLADGPLAQEPSFEASQPETSDIGENASNDAEPELLPETPAGSEVDTQAASDPKTRYAAWSLGSTLSLAALANDRAASEEKVTGWFTTARQQAEALGTTVADLPPRPAADQVDLEGQRATEYLFSQGQAIGSHLAASLGDDHNALFEVALKSNILLVRYQPEVPVSKLLAAAISQASERAQLPPELVQPVLQGVEAKATVKEVRDAVFDMHDRVGQYLSTGQL